MNDSFKILKARARSAIERNDLNGAIQLLDEALSSAPNASGYRLRGKCYFNIGKKEEALRDCASATITDPEDIYELKDFASRYEEKGDYQAARSFLYAALEFDPSDGDIYYSLGCIYLKEKKFSEALDSYERADHFSGPCFWRSMHRAEIYNNLKLKQQRNTEYEKALEFLNSPDPELLRFLESMGERREKQIIFFKDAINHFMSLD
jgi:tetratricopeptide (TPR) repeat protein